MDILQFREKVKAILDKEGASFPSWNARQQAVTSIAERAIDSGATFCREAFQDVDPVKK
jgi:hypothetical protein